MELIMKTTWGKARSEGSEQLLVESRIAPKVASRMREGKKAQPPAPREAGGVYICSV